MRRKTGSSLPLGMIVLGGMLLLGAMAWMLWFRLGGNDEISQQTLQEMSVSAAKVPRVSLADAKAAFDTHSAVFVDVRAAEAYAQAHIPGALSIPLAELPQRLGELDPAAWIITY